jgi:polysaccharide export outer membrane protein
MIKNYNLLFLIFLLTLFNSCSSVSFDDPQELSEDIQTSNQDEPKAAEELTLPRMVEQQPLQSGQPNQPQPQIQEQQPSQLQKIQAVIEPKNPEEILSSYRLGKGDLISIKVFGEEDFSVTTHLSKEGTISYPFLGELTLSGLTVKEAEKQISRGLRGDYLVNPKVTLTVLEYRKLFVNGEVKSPGGYTFVPGMTVNKAISLAGGFTESASREEIFIIREGNPSASPSLADLKTYVGPGDIIIIKEYQKFFVDGEVRKPGSYVYEPGLTVNKAISTAGGFTDRASREEIFIIHKGREESKTLVTLNASVEPGDIVAVKEYKKFFVNGEVKQPGSYDFILDLTVEKAISIAGGFSQYASPRWSKILILRDKNKNGTSVPVELNTPVYPGDIITVEESTF